MTPDTLVIDTETKNTFADVGGQSRLIDLNLSFVGVYSYNQNAYLSFFEDDFAKMNELFKNAGLVIGFSINRFDIPLLNKYVQFDLFKISRFDILDEIEEMMGQRIGLNILAKTNLGMEKTNHWYEAIKFYKEGNLKALEIYCLQDVRMTKELYELIKKRGYLLMPERQSGELVQVKFNFREPAFHPTLF